MTYGKEGTRTLTYRQDGRLTDFMTAEIMTDAPSLVLRQRADDSRRQSADCRRFLNIWNSNRIQARVAIGNYPSQAVCDRSGLKKEGVLRQAEWLYDHYVDLTMNGVLRTEWKEQRSGGPT